VESIKEHLAVRTASGRCAIRTLAITASRVRGCRPRATLLGLFILLCGVVPERADANRCESGELDCYQLPEVPAVTPEPRIGGWTPEPGGGPSPWSGPGSAFCQNQVSERPQDCFFRTQSVSPWIGMPGPNSGLAFLARFANSSPGLAHAVRNALNTHTNGIFTGYPGPGFANNQLVADVQGICSAQAQLTPVTTVPHWAVGPYDPLDPGFVPQPLSHCWAALQRLREEAGLSEPSVETQIRDFLNGGSVTTIESLGASRYTGLVQGILSVIFALDNGTIASPTNSLQSRLSAILAVHRCELWYANSDAAGCGFP